MSWKSLFIQWLPLNVIAANFFALLDFVFFPESRRAEGSRLVLSRVGPRQQSEPERRGRSPSVGVRSVW